MGKIKENIDMTYHAEPFKVRTFEVGNPSYYEFKNLKDMHLDLKKRTQELESSQSKLSEDLKKVTKTDTTNQIRVGGIERGMRTNNHFTWSFGSVSIITIVGVVSFGIVLCQKLRAKNRELNQIIIKDSGNNKEEKTTEVV